MRKGIRGCQRPPSELLGDEQHHQPQGNYTGYRPPSAISVLTAREGQDVVLLQQGSFHYMRSLFKCILGKMNSILVVTIQIILVRITGVFDPRGGGGE